MPNPPGDERPDAGAALERTARLLATRHEELRREAWAGRRDSRQARRAECLARSLESTNRALEARIHQLCSQCEGERRRRLEYKRRYLREAQVVRDLLALLTQQRDAAAATTRARGVGTGSDAPLLIGGKEYALSQLLHMYPPVRDEDESTDSDSVEEETPPVVTGMRAEARPPRRPSTPSTPGSDYVSRLREAIIQHVTKECLVRSAQVQCSVESTPTGDELAFHVQVSFGGAHASHTSHTPHVSRFSSPTPVPASSSVSSSAPAPTSTSASVALLEEPPSAPTSASPPRAPRLNSPRLQLLAATPYAEPPQNPFDRVVSPRSERRLETPGVEAADDRLEDTVFPRSTDGSRPELDNLELLLSPTSSRPSVKSSLGSEVAQGGTTIPRAPDDYL
ncbi:hypothetical protein GMRT_11327 [Giardia muris]|uniref:Uncharacterized protein n=1 Tax=Giardia muris TaxID=5742 RepID=A0A4Z1T2I2_GIAMU|nr:hypothetical protein GMRT_11327 [Giardia muris]|eukprot:TNJ26621.1 hypothetical protein GMRT_11327 [Giardia muris]